jgi:27-O-demethylrifamycin SV methyltransferase
VSTDVRHDDYDPAAHYDRVTRAWALIMGDDLHYGVFDRPDEPLATATARLTHLMAEHAALSPGLRVLDVGCGTGGPARQLVADHDVSVLGVSTSAVGIAAADHHAADVPGARFEVRDGTATGLPDASADRVWVLESSHLMPDRAALLADAARVLAPGGRLVLCDIVRRRDIPFLELRERRDDFATLRAGFGAARMDPLATYAAHAAAAGLEVETELDLTDATRPTFDAWRHNLDRHRAEVLDLIGADGTAAFEASLPILERFWDDGTLGYGLIAARKPA